MVGQAITSVLQVIICPTKGQLISECPFGPKTSSKIPTKLLPDFCPEIFCSFLGASWKLLGASCRLPCLWYYLLIPPGKCFTCFTKTFANLTTYTGYLTLKCPNKKSVSSKIPTKLFLDFCTAFWASLGSNIINKEPYRKPKKAFRKAPGSYKKFQGRNPDIMQTEDRTKWR